MNQNKKNSILTYCQNLLSYKPKEQYHFSIPEISEQTSNQESSANTSLQDTTPQPPKDIFSDIVSNLEAITIRYNTLINSDIIIREFHLIVKNKEYKAFLLYIDGMVDTASINHFVLKPLMLRNMANTYQAEDNKTTKQTPNNTTLIRKVKKFDLSTYIFNHLVPQNSVKRTRNF